MPKRSNYFDEILIKRRINPKYPNIWYNQKNKRWIGYLGDGEYELGKNKYDVLKKIEAGFFDQLYDYEFYNSDGLKTNHWKYSNLKASTAINDISTKLNINKSKLSKLLGQSKITINEWEKFKLNSNEIPFAFERLIFFHYLIKLLNNEDILNKLKDKITIRNSLLSPLDIIFNNPTKKELKEVAKILNQD